MSANKCATALGLRELMHLPLQSLAWGTLSPMFLARKIQNRGCPEMFLGTLDHQLVALLQSHGSLSINTCLPQMICMRKGKGIKKPQQIVNFWMLISVRKSIILVTKCFQKHRVLRDIAFI